MYTPDAPGVRDGAAAQAFAPEELLRSCLPAAAGAAPLGGFGWSASHENNDQVSSGGGLPPVCRDHVEADLLCYPCPAAAVSGGFSGHGAGGSFAGAPGYLRLCGDSVLPHPLRLLQLCQRIHLSIWRIGGALSSGTEPGNSGGGPNAGKFRPPGSYTLYRRRHPHHPHGVPAEPAAGSHRPQFGSHRLPGIHGGGRPAGYHHPGEAPGAGPPRSGPGEHQPPVHGRPGPGPLRPAA